MSFEPVAPEGQEPQVHISLDLLAAGVQDVLNGEGGAFLQTLLLVGGSPQGARPKALVYRDARDGSFTTAVKPGFDAWLMITQAPCTSFKAESTITSGCFAKGQKPGASKVLKRSPGGNLSKSVPPGDLRITQILKIFPPLALDNSTQTAHAPSPL